jgi:hypothetical protein
MVQLGVVQAVEQMDRAGTRSRHAHAWPARELGVADGLERAHLLVPGLDEPWPVISPTEGTEDAVYPVAWVREHRLDIPFAQSGQQNVSDFVGHLISP